MHYGSLPRIIHKIEMTIVPSSQTHALSYHKEMPHFKMHKVVLEVGTRYLGGREGICRLFQRPSPLKIGQPYHNSQMQQAYLEYSE